MRLIEMGFSVTWQEELDRLLFSEDEMPKKVTIDKHNRKPQVFSELEIAHLSHDIIDGGTLYPAGTLGTVVYVHNKGEGYEFEVSKPNHNVLTVHQDDLVK